MTVLKIFSSVNFEVVQNPSQIFCGGKKHMLALDYYSFFERIVKTF